MYKISFFILLFLFSTFLTAGEEDAKRKAEHEKVKAHIEENFSKISKFPAYHPNLPDKNSGKGFSLNKSALERPPRKSYILNGNKITTIAW